jgi:hypothetical protein
MAGGAYSRQKGDFKAGNKIVMAAVLQVGE